jgi:hypothetical protein
MNILLWVLQILLALYYLVGGMYMANHYKILANESALNSLPATAWIALAMLQILFAIGLVLPGVVRKFRKLIPISAAGLVIISLLGSALYVAYAGSGILWAIVPAILLAFIVYGRLRQS